MKRILSMLIAVILVLSMIPAAANAAQPVTVYVDPQKGSNANSGTEDSPVQNFTRAYEFLQNGGGTVVMLSTVYYASTYTFPACSYPVTITGKTGSEGIRTASNIVVSGDTTFQNMTFTHLKASTATLICGNGHKLTMGEGITTVPYTDDTGSYHFCLQGGAPSGNVAGTNLTVQSGQYRNIYTGSYLKTVNGDVNFTMTGGSAAVVAPGYSGSVNGNVNMTISGSANISNALYAGSWTTGNISGNSNITLGAGAYIKNLFAAGNGAGSVSGTTTVTVDGYEYSGTLFKGKGHSSHTGTLGGSRLVLKSGRLNKAPTDFGSVEIDIPQGKTLTLATTLTADRLQAEGALVFSGAVSLTAKAVSGQVNCQIEGQALKNQVYITAPAGSAIAFPAETGITENNGTWVNRDLDAFAGLVLKAETGVKMNLYGGIWAQGTDTVYTVVTPYATETKDGYNYYYYPNAQGNYHVRASRSGYITLYKNIYQSPEEAAAKTVETVTLEKKGTSGYVPSTIYSHSTETLEREETWKSEASMYPKYEAALTNPVFSEGRDAHQMTTQSELLADLYATDKPGDDMYLYTLGYSELYNQEIPVAIFTTTDLSSAKTLEEAAARMGKDKLTVYYRAQMHGNEPGGGEGALAMIHYLQLGYGEEILDKLNIIIVPRLSPDSSQLYQRLLPNEINPNRDQMLLESAEMAAFQRGYLLFDPQIVLDGHERVWNNRFGDIQVSACFTPMNSDAYRTVALELDEAAFAELTANNLNGYYYAANVNEKDTNMGGGYYAATGSIYVLMETRGIYGGNEAMERRAVSHMAAVTGMLDYLHANDRAVMDMIARERQTVSEKGATYEEDDQFILETKVRTTTAADKEAWGILNTLGQDINWATGEVTLYERYPNVNDVVVRSRTAPTAYVIPANVENISKILSLMDQHGISYEKLPAGATLTLQQYGGTTTQATLGEATAKRFPDGAYVFAMNQEKALLLAAFFEPDHTNSAEFYGNLTQMGLLSVSNTYRYITDLNGSGSVDYTITDSDPVTVTVYLDGTNGSDSNTGLTAATAVKTLEKAYALMASAMAGADKHSSATLILVGMYDLGAQQSKLPAADFPVTITGNTAADGFKYTGGTSQATRTFEIQGATTFRNITIHINNDQAFNFFLANGHKLVIGEGMNFTTNKANCYFTLAGGSYDYAQSTPSTDVTVRSGKWRTIYAGGYRANVTGDAKLDVSGAWVYQNIAATYCGTIENVYMTIENTTVSDLVDTSAIYAGPLDYTATHKQGRIKGNSVVRLGENVTALAVYGSSRTNGYVDGTAIIIADGVDLSAVPFHARCSGTKGSTNQVLLQLEDHITKAVTLGGDFLLDLCGYDMTDLTLTGTATVYDSATDDYDVSDGVYGQITGAVTGTLVAKDGYIAAAKGFHKFGGQYISSVSLRPGNAGIYYGATFLCDEVLAQTLEMGVAVSLVDMPGSDFATDEDTKYTVGTTGVMIQNILTGDTEDADRAIMDIYAASYVKLPDGTVLVSENEVAYSLYDILLILKDQNPEEFAKFCTTWNISTWF